MKAKISILILLLVLGTLFVVFYNKQQNQKQVVSESEQQKKDFDGRDASFVIDGNRITLVGGKYEIQSAPDSDQKIKYKYFGNEAKGDLNFDGEKDDVFLVTQDGGGTGLFYYAVAAIKTGDSYSLTDAFYIGDRIAPQATFVPTGSGIININYADRRSDESMSTVPTIDTTLYLKVTPEGVLQEVEGDE